MKRLGEGVVISAVIGLALVAVSCSSGPPPLQPGTPAFYWAAAQQTFTTGDYVKANDNLSHLTQSDNEFTARALPWQLVLTSGMAQGFEDLAEYFELGARAKRDNPTPFRRQVDLLQRNASSLAVQFAEAYLKFEQTNKDANIPLAFPYPSGSTMPIPTLKRVSSGIIVPDAEIDSFTTQSLQRGVLLATCAALGVGDDSSKAAEMFKAPEVQAPRNAFVLSMAQALYRNAQLFSRDKLDRPDRLDLLTKEALEAANSVPDSKESKALIAKIQKGMKRKR
jgi:hypothetical protein